MLLWCLQYGQTALIRASWNGHIDVVMHLMEHRADVNAKDKVVTALPDGSFDCSIVRTFCDAAMVCAAWSNCANKGLREWPH